ncbi:MAG: hypothetical protein II888_00925 [Clostridia bacterium]|nr:hypothetical protein [Clostridia bacterium]
MLRRIVCGLLMLTMLFGLALAETPDAAVTVDLALDDFTLALESSWVIDTGKAEDETMVASASSIDGQDLLMVFLSAEGDENEAVSMAAVNEYSSGIRRGATEEVNGVKVIFAAAEEGSMACAYFSVNGHVYTVTLQSNREDATSEELVETLGTLMKTMTPNIG